MMLNPALQELHRSFAELIIAEHSNGDIYFSCDKDRRNTWKYQLQQKLFPGLLLSPVKEILHTNDSIKLEENTVQSYFQIFKRTGGGQEDKSQHFLASIHMLTRTGQNHRLPLLHCNMHAKQHLQLLTRSCSKRKSPSKFFERTLQKSLIFMACHASGNYKQFWVRKHSNRF